MPRVVHFEIHAEDMDRAERFYSEVFGWEVQRWEGAPTDYRLLGTGPDDHPGINGALTERPGAVPAEGAAANAYVCTVEVESIEETEQRVPEAGGKQVMDRMEVPAVGQVSYFRDTEGNVFGALEPIAS